MWHSPWIGAVDYIKAPRSGVGRMLPPAGPSAPRNGPPPKAIPGLPRVHYRLRVRVVNEYQPLLGARVVKVRPDPMIVSREAAALLSMVTGTVRVGRFKPLTSTTGIAAPTVAK